MTCFEYFECRMRKFSVLLSDNRENREARNAQMKVTEFQVHCRRCWTLLMKMKVLLQKMRHNDDVSNDTNAGKRKKTTNKVHRAIRDELERRESLAYSKNKNTTNTETTQIPCPFATFRPFRFSFSIQTTRTPAPSAQEPLPTPALYFSSDAKCFHAQQTGLRRRHREKEDRERVGKREKHISYRWN